MIRRLQTFSSTVRSSNPDIIATLAAVQREFDNVYKGMEQSSVSVDPDSGLTQNGNVIGAKVANASQTGMLSAADWSRFDKGGSVNPSVVTPQDIANWNGKQDAYTNLTTIGVLANAVGWLHNDGSGVLSYSTPSSTPPTLASTHIGVGSVSNLLSGSSALTFDGTTLSVTGAIYAYGISAKKFNAVDSSGTGLYDGGGVNGITVQNGGNVGIGTTTPSARLHLAAGVATAFGAPFKLTSGVNLTSPEDGALEYDGSHLYFTIGSTRSALGGGGGSSVWTDDGTYIYPANLARNVGIGTTSPGQKLVIQGGAFTSVQTTLNLGMFAGQAQNSFPTYSTIDTSYLNSYYGNTIAGETNDYERYLDIVINGASDGANGAGVIRFLANNATNGSNPTELMRIVGKSGNVGIGTMTPAARLHLAAGVATASGAPFKLTSGVNLTSPEDGALEYDGSHLYFTIGSTRSALV